MTGVRVGRYVDYERLVVTWLAGRLRTRLPAARVGTVKPGDFTGDFVWVTGVGGTDNGDLMVARVDLHSFRPGGRGAATALAGVVHEEMGNLDGQTVEGQPVYTVGTVMIPVHRFWSASADRLVATYDLDLPVL